VVSLITRQVIAAGTGLLYAVMYGFWTMLATGGGHGNFIWFLLFLFVEFVGLYFPLMCVLAVNLKSFFVKVIFGSLIGFNLIASTIMVLGWILDTEPGRNGTTDFERMMNINGVGWIIFSIAAHFLPTLIFAFLLVRSILLGTSLGKDDDNVSLNLH